LGKEGQALARGIQDKFDFVGWYAGVLFVCVNVKNKKNTCTLLLVV